MLSPAELEVLTKILERGIDNSSDLDDGEQATLVSLQKKGLMDVYMGGAFSPNACARSALEEAQREQAAEKVCDRRRSRARFWLALLFTLLGVFLGAFIATHTAALRWFTELF